MGVQMGNAMAMGTVMVLGLLASAVGQQPKPMMGEIRFFDKYGREVTLAYEGGHVTMKGTVTGGCTKLQLVHRDSGKVVDDKTCDQHGVVTFSLKLEKGMGFSVYIARSNGVDSSDTFNMEYFLSANGSNDCGKLTCSPGSYCVMGAKGANCSGLDRVWCTRQHKDTGFSTCDGNHDSLCDAIAVGANALVEQTGTRSCRGGDQPRMMYNSSTYKFNDHIPVYPNIKQFTIHCPDTSVAYHNSLRCNVTQWDGQEIATFTKDSCNDLFKDNFMNSVFDKGWQVFNMYCQFENTQGAVLARMWYHLVVLGDTTVAITKQPSAAGGQYTESLTCEPTPQPSPEFNVTYMWSGTNIKQQDVNGSKVGINVDDTIEAEVHAEYTPYIPKNGVFKATTPKSPPQQVQASPVKPTTTHAWTGTGSRPTSPPITKTTIPSGAGGEDKLPWWVHVVIGVIGLILLAVIVIVVIICKNRGRKGSVEEARVKQVPQTPQVNEKALAVLNQNDPGRGRTMEVTKMVETMFIVEGVEPQKQFSIEHYGKLFPNEPKATAETPLPIEGLTQVKECRYHNHPYWHTYTATQLVIKDLHITNKRCLHANIIPDLYNNTIIISQAPVETQMFAHLVGYWENNVRVVVVVGKFAETGKNNEGKVETQTKIDPYWSLEEFQTHICWENPKDPKSRRFELLTNSVVRDQHGCDTYVITMKRSDQNEERDIALIHLKDWPDFNVPKKPTDVCKTILHISDLRQRLGPNVAAHCSAGMQRSVSVVALLLSHQAVVHTHGRSNPIGYLRYVRDHRWGALSPEILGKNKAFMQMQLMVAATGLLMTWHSDTIGGRQGVDEGRAGRFFKGTGASQRAQPKQAQKSVKGGSARMDPARSGRGFSLRQKAQSGRGE